MKIYLDMDGVLTDFDGRYAELFGERPAEDGQRKQHFWGNWNTFVDGNHFATLALHRDAHSILQTVKLLNAPVAILSSSGGGYSHNMVIEQKRYWLAQHGINFPAYFVPGGKYKARYAEPDAILVDDTEKNIDGFREAGGVGIVHKNVADTVTQLYTFYKENQK